MRFLLTLFLLLAPLTLSAQGPRHSFPATLPSVTPISGGLPDTLRPQHDLALAMGGLLAGTTGLVLGAYAGAALEQSTGCAGDDWCGLGGGLLGAALGTTFMVPVGVHLANNQRGNLGQGIAASGFTLAAGIGFSMLINDARPMLLVPLAQIISSIATERRTEGPLTAPGISP
ncbi:MAG TPA: hypothetical protein VK012_07125 [Gemmatimonadales bacterium]|nr:hypothetical protein [Gemmatimonadales bacterium]